MRSVERLVVWREANALVVRCYELARGFPRGEGWAIADQLRRAAISVAINIAEGRGRGSKREFRRFLQIANGSVFEVDALLALAVSLEFLSSADVAPLSRDCLRLSNMLRALDAAIARQAARPDPPRPD